MRLERPVSQYVHYGHAFAYQLPSDQDGPVTFERLALGAPDRDAVLRASSDQPLDAGPKQLRPGEFCVADAPISVIAGGIGTACPELGAQEYILYARLGQ